MIEKSPKDSVLFAAHGPNSHEQALSELSKITAMFIIRYVICGERNFAKRNHYAIVGMAWIKNIKHVNGYVKIPYLVKKS